MIYIHIACLIATIVLSLVSLRIDRRTRRRIDELNGASRRSMTRNVGDT